MHHPFAAYFLFLAKSLSLALILFVLLAAIVSLVSKAKSLPGTLSIKNVSNALSETQANLREQILSKKERKQLKKLEKQAAKNEPKAIEKKVFVLNFNGDLQASQVNALRQEVTAILQIATPKDEVVLKLESPGGMISGYGLAASQLARFKEQQIPLTVCIDKIAASGGYLMACVANEIIAAPFAIIGSIGVIAQLPNFHRFLKKHDIDFEQITAGKYKRTLSMFGENTKEGREKMQEDLEEMHVAFKNYIANYRSAVNLEEVANGDYWLAVDAERLKLVDRLMTSDDYLLFLSQHAEIFELRYTSKKSFIQKLQGQASRLLSQVF